MPRIEVKKVSNKKPKKVGKGAESVKTHNAGHVGKPKKVNAVNAKNNYGVKDNK